MKNISVLIIAGFIAFAFSSCKPHEKCPAYSYQEKDTHEQELVMVQSENLITEEQI